MDFSLAATRDDDGTIVIDSAPAVIHVAAELYGQLAVHGSRWRVGTPGRGAGEAIYRFTGEQAGQSGDRVAVLDGVTP